MLRAELAMTIATGDEPAFEREWLRVSEWVADQPGSVRQTLARLDGEQTTYLITSDWVDEPSFRAFETSNRQDEVTSGLRRLRQSARMTVSTILHHKESTSSLVDATMRDQ
nr:antibiotic biosynthesis monooxygenase [Kibdelosporangium sp. MJ126-NF4]CEL19956.1 GrhU [Kibdelosporangium sp. MJ126-NF4]CTQ97180.1 GrhU [Kibdelosporangium sp. MJ126-NF4]